MRTEAEIKELLDMVLSKCTAPSAQAHFNSKHQVSTRFADNAIIQNSSEESESIYLEIAYGLKHGGAQSDRTDPESIQRLVETAEKIALHSPEDPEKVEFLAAQNYTDTPTRYFPDINNRGPLDMANEIHDIIEIAKRRSFKASGLFTTSQGASAIANNRGLFAYDHSSSVETSVTAHGANGSASASRSAEDPAQIDVMAMAEEAFNTATAAQDPKEIGPGDYTVIFEPSATWEFLLFLLFNLSARKADEGASVFTDKVGEKIFGEKVNFSLEINDPQLPPAHFGANGLPVARCDWVKDGVLTDLYYDRFWAKEKNRAPHAALTPFFMKGENNSVTDLVAGCERGLLVKNIWYIRYVDEKELLLTGMTRDGLFLVENGKIVHPVKNMRFNESPLVFLNNITAMSEAVRVNRMAKIPGVMSENFTFDSCTESI